MSSNTQKLKLREAINLTNYQLNIRNEFIKFLESTYGSQKHRLYLFSRSESTPKIFLLQLQIPVKFNNKSYDISLLVYFPLDFPNIEPEIYVEKVGKIRINPNCSFYIDEESLKINYGCFYQWKSSFESFRNLIAELYNQFNMAFPVFNDSNKVEDINELQGDCYLKKNLCREVELVNPIVEKSKNKNNNINNAPNINMNNNNYGQDNQILNNPYQIKHEPVFDENKSKQSLIKLLQKDLYQKINYAVQPITTSYLKLEKIKENIHQKLKDIEKVERKEDNIRQTLNSLHKELDFNIPEQKEFGKPDMNNLDSALIISNKDYYMNLAKEKVIEEYILIVKKNYEKQNIDFNTALNLIRVNSRNIFFIRYKNAHRFDS